MTSICDITNDQILTRQVNDFLHEMNASLKVTFEPTNLLSYPISILPLSDFVQKGQNEHDIKRSEIKQKLTGFTPLHTARCQVDNEFLVLKDDFPLFAEKSQDVFKLKDYIDVGLYEPIFHWRSAIVQVILSMGKHTTHKSYLLNHVTGSSFNISGAQCTDGCCVTLNVQEIFFRIISDL